MWYNKFIMTLSSAKNYSSCKEWKDAYWKKILKSEKLLNRLITANEKRDLIIRAAVTEKLLAGESYLNISKELWVSSQTISGIKKALNKEYKSYQERNKIGGKKVYSPGPKRKPKFKHAGDIGFYRRTKYGKVWIPF